MSTDRVEGRSGPAAPVAPDSMVSATSRFVVELVAWIAAPWALAPYSAVLAVLAVVALIGLPGVFGMPGAKELRPAVPVAAWLAVALELLQPFVACVAAFAAWSTAAAGIVVIAALIACALQLRRWRWMLARPAVHGGRER